MADMFSFGVNDEVERAYPDPQWKKGCPDSVVLFATDGRGTVTVLDHQGPDAAYLMGDSLIRATFLEGDLATWAFPGLWVWEGHVRGWKDYFGEYDEENVGDIRPLTDDEARAVREEDHVWDGGLWLEDWKP